MDQDDVDSLAVEKVCEEKFDRPTEVINRRLLHDLVHSLENHILIDDLLLYSLVHCIVHERVGKHFLEHLIACCCGAH